MRLSNAAMKNIELNTVHRELFYVELKNYLVVIKLRDSFICEWSYKWQSITLVTKDKDNPKIIRSFYNYKTNNK